jgi:hypothetical protein
LIENVLLVCFALKIFSAIKISRCRASQQESLKKIFVGKILKSDKKKLNKKLSRKKMSLKM